jgi:hypothetical protein
MQYCVLIYDSEKIVQSRPKHEDDALLAKHAALQRELAAEGKLGPAIRLVPTSAARTYRPGRDAFTDGPFAETKEQLLGLYVIECETDQEAQDIARRIANCCVTREYGALEVRPISWLPTLGFAAPKAS